MATSNMPKNAPVFTKKVKGGGIATLIDWNQVARLSVAVINSFLQRGITPNLRTVYYALVSREIIPNTKSSYKNLSESLVKARKNKVVPWDAIQDEGRRTRGGDVHFWGGPEEYAQMYVDNFWQRIQKYSLPRWHKQYNYVEVFIEKEAMADTFDTILRSRGITVVPCKGYSSWTYMKDAALRIEEAINGGEKEPTILYFGDYDPSGMDAERFLGEALDWFLAPGKFTEGVNVKIKRICITQDQIERYKLPNRPDDEEEIAKMKRDPRFAKWPWGLYRVELDALFAFVPDEFERIVTEAVDEYFDEGISEEVREQETVERDAALIIAVKMVEEKLKEYRESKKKTS